MTETLFTSGSALLVLFLGTLVLYRNYREVLRLLFFGFCLSLAFWQSMLLISEKQTSQVLLFNRLTFVGPIMAVGLFTAFIGRLQTIAAKRKIPAVRKTNILVTVVTSSAIFLAISPWVSQSVKARLDQTGFLTGYNVGRGPLYIVYIFCFTLLFALAVRSVYDLARRRDDLSRKQASIIRKGVFIAVFVGFFTNAILPTILRSSKFSYLGSIAVVILVATLALAIARHKLIDVRSFVARSFGYLLTIGAIVLIYFIGVSGFIEYIFGIFLSLKTKLALFLVVVVGAVAYQPLKQRFDRITNRIFYQDSYDSQKLFNHLNEQLVTSLDITQLMPRTIQIIEDAFRPTYLTVQLYGDNVSVGRSFGSANTVDNKTLLKLRDFAAGRPERSFTLQSKVEHELQQAMKAKDIGVITRLTQDTSRPQNDVGLIILGQRKSGKRYTDEDLAVLDSVSNELLLAIQNCLRYEEIQNFNTTLQQRVDDATRKLRRTNQRLKELDEAKDDFVSMASHQLRTPLTAIKGNVSLVMEGDAGPVTKTQVELLGQAFASSQRMVFLIADLLNVSRLKTGKFVIEPGQVNLADMVAQEVAQLQETAQSRQVSLAFAKPETFSTLKLDETKTRQVIMNFIDNAIYYTQSGGAIEVSLKETDKEVEFRVKDNGIGVPRHEQPHLFTKFYRAENARKARPDGTGLGLFMAKKIIVGQGGAIIFETKEGKGSTFGFRFPKAHLVV